MSQTKTGDIFKEIGREAGFVGEKIRGTNRTGIIEYKIYPLRHVLLFIAIK
jgi:hypothetical protein